MSKLPGLIIIALLGVIINGCSGPTTPVIETPAPELFDDLRYDAVSFKTSHNSYDRGLSISAQLDWDPDHPWQGGCSGIELDLQWEADFPDQWRVHHESYEYGRPLSDYLADLTAWSLAHPHHRVITIDLEHKDDYSEPEQAMQAFDNYLDDYFDIDRIYTPREMLHRDDGSDYPDLLSAVRAKGGWPRLAELRGRFIFIQNKLPVADPLCFARLEPFDLYNDGNPQVLIYNDQINDRDPKQWTGLVERIRGDVGIVLRGYKVNGCSVLGGLFSDDETCGPRLWSNALTSGLNMIATDHVNHPSVKWSMVGTRPMWPLATRKWSEPQLITGGITVDAAPCAVVFRDSLFVFYQRNQGLYYLTRHDDEWSGEQDLPVRSPGAPTAAVFGDRLYLVHRSPEGELRSLIFDGTAWAGGGITDQNGAMTAGDVGLAVYRNRLHVIYPDRMTGDLRTFLYDGKSWSKPVRMWTDATPVRSSAGPALGVLGGTLYAFWPDADGKILRGENRGRSWSDRQDMTDINGATATTRIAVIGNSDELEVLYPGGSDGSIWSFSCRPGGDVSAQTLTIAGDGQLSGGICAAYHEQSAWLMIQGEGGLLYGITRAAP